MATKCVDKAIVLSVVALVLLFGCKQGQFAIESPEHDNLVHVESGLYVHRETELRVNAARFGTPPADAAPGAAPGLAASRFFPSGVSSAYFRPLKEEREGYLTWVEVSHLSRDDLNGETARGVHVRWERDGAVTAYDVLEIFQFPPPDISQLNNWSTWFEASSRRKGSFGWHAEAHRHAAETPAAPAHPFQVRFRLVLSPRMYP